MTATKRQLDSQKAVKRLTPRGKSNWDAAKAELRRLKERYPIEAKLLANSRLQRTRGRHRRVGTSYHEIELATWMLDDQDTEEVLNTVRHEFAHAITPSYAPQHGEEWRLAADVLGVPRQRTAHNPYRYVALCPACGIIKGVGWYRQPATPRIHNVCGNRVNIVDTTQLSNPEALQRKSL